MTLSLNQPQVYHREISSWLGSAHSISHRGTKPPETAKISSGHTVTPFPHLKITVAMRIKGMNTGALSLHGG